MRELIIQGNDANQRIDKFLMKYINQAPKGFIYKMLRKKRIKYNNKKAQGNEILQVGDKIQLYLSDETIIQFQQNTLLQLSPVPKTFQVIYEDKNILVCNKPSGLLTHPDHPNQTNTLLHQVIYYLYQKQEYIPEKEQGFVPGVCNRLDRNTSGLIIIGKNLLTLQEINALLKQQKIHRYYMAIVKGKLYHDGKLTGFYSKNRNQNKGQVYLKPSKKSKPIETLYHPLQVGADCTLLEVQLVTGRTHQIRVHLSSIDHPIGGDPKYGDQQWNQYLYQQYKVSNQLLHAYKIKFPSTSGHLYYLSEKEIVSSPPTIFQQIIS